jgi:hypothetical protein
MEMHNVFKNMVYTLLLLLFVSGFILCCQKKVDMDDTSFDSEHPLSFEAGLQKGLENLAATEGYEALQTIDALNLFSYLSGYYKGGHNFPALFYDPQNNTFTVTSSYIQKTFLFHQFENALSLYKEVLIEKGYEIDGVVKDNTIYIEVDGEEMVILNLAELFPNTKETKSFFTDHQYDFIYKKLGGWQGFSYLSGVGETDRDFPLMVGVGYMDTARLRVLGKGMAHAFKFDELDRAFNTYRTYIEQRTQNSN